MRAESPAKSLVTSLVLVRGAGPHSSNKRVEGCIPTFGICPQWLRRVRRDPVLGEHELTNGDSTATCAHCYSTTAACWFILRARLHCVASLVQELLKATSVSDVIRCISKVVLIFANKLHDEGLHHLR